MAIEIIDSFKAFQIIHIFIQLKTLLVGFCRFKAEKLYAIFHFNIQHSLYTLKILWVFLNCKTTFVIKNRSIYLLFIVKLFCSVHRCGCFRCECVGGATTTSRTSCARLQIADLQTK